MGSWFGNGIAISEEDWKIGGSEDRRMDLLYGGVAAGHEVSESRHEAPSLSGTLEKL